jgi:hypothetical protein
MITLTRRHPRTLMGLVRSSASSGGHNLKLRGLQVPLGKNEEPDEVVSDSALRRQLGVCMDVRLSVRHTFKARRQQTMHSGPHI